MRRQFLLLVIILVGTATLVSAQEGQPQPTDQPTGEPLQAAPRHMVSGAWQPVELEQIDTPPAAILQLADPASDSCSDAPDLDLGFVGGDGGQTITNSMTEETSDPVLSCVWGAPQRSQGFRTVWYKLEPERSGTVKITTFGSKYDTVLAIYRDDGANPGENSCSNLTQLSCNDDQNGFSSQFMIPVRVGEVYYIEAADWHFPINGQATLDLAAAITSTTNWQVVKPGLDPLRSRHAAVVVGDDIYVIGGQTILGEFPVRTRVTQRYDAGENKWHSLADMSAAYSNTTAAHVNGNIYLPSGFVGVDGNYDGTHWVYNIAANNWSTTTPNNWAGGMPAIYSASVPNSGSPQLYFLLGGLTGPLPVIPPPDGDPVNWVPRNEAYFFAPGAGWTQIAPMNVGRFGPMAAAQRINNKDYICVTGGVSKGKDVDDNDIAILEASTECYNINTGSWDLSAANQLNRARYFGGSTVDAAGNWYIFGGADGAGEPVAVTERFDRTTLSWVMLDGEFDLAFVNFNDPLQTRPPRIWPRGGFVGQTIWSFGGETLPSSGGEEGRTQVLNLVEKVFIPPPPTPPSLPPTAYLPILFKPIISTGPNNTFSRALPLALNQPQYSRFEEPNDIFDVFFFDIPSTRDVRVKVSNIPSSDNYILYVYTSNKLFLGVSNNPGANNENLTLQSLASDRYFIVVQRLIPQPGFPPSSKEYRIEVNG